MCGLSSNGANECFFRLFAAVRHFDLTLFLLRSTDQMRIYSTLSVRLAVIFSVSMFVFWAVVYCIDVFLLDYFLTHVSRCCVCVSVYFFTPRFMHV